MANNNEPPSSQRLTKEKAYELFQRLLDEEDDDYDSDTASDFDMFVPIRHEDESDSDEFQQPLAKHQRLHHKSSSGPSTSAVTSSSSVVAKQQTKGKGKGVGKRTRQPSPIHLSLLQHQLGSQRRYLSLHHPMPRPRYQLLLLLLRQVHLLRELKIKLLVLDLLLRQVHLLGELKTKPSLIRGNPYQMIPKLGVHRFEILRLDSKPL